MIKNISLTIGIAIGLAANAVAYTTLDFPGWTRLIQNSAEIIVVRCVETTSPNPKEKDAVEHNLRGLVDSDIEIVSTLKGALNSKTTRLRSEYRPFQNEYYLIFVRSNDGICEAFEPYRIVPLGLSFAPNDLNSKTLNEQVLMLLQRRLNDLNRQMDEEQQEKERLEQAVQK